MTRLILGVLCAMTLGLTPAATAPRQAPYGTWTSPLSAADLGGATLGFSTLRAVDGALYWLEYRPHEAGRSVVMRLNGDQTMETVTPDGFNVRSRVHEYGGTPYGVAGDTVYFSHFADQRIYAQTAGEPPFALTPAEPFRFADCAVDAGRNRLICVREDHRPETLADHGEARNGLVAIDRHTGAQTILVQGSDFVAYPRLSPDGATLVWTAWDHPNMPWDTISLQMARVGADGRLSEIRTLNEGQRESVLQPRWTADGRLLFLADRSGYWALYEWENGTVRPVIERPADLGGPLWSLGESWFDVLADGRIIAAYTEGAKGELGLIDPATGLYTPIDLGPAEIHDPTVVGGRLYGVASFPDRMAALVAIDPETGMLDTLREAGEQPLDPSFIAVPSATAFPTGEGEQAHAFYYPPTNPHFTAPEGETPPLIVTVHGGPTGHRSSAFRLDMQYWTTRGFAVLDVNYRGSTGFGRAYRERLYGEWGIADVEDAVKGALHMADRGLADRNRLLIRGGSAGGYVVLAAMAFHDVFAAGANYFGVSDAEALAKDTHKFESRYLDQLIGPYPERRDLYVARSPIHHLDGFDRPLIVLQGLQDRIVPPNQSEAIVNALRKKGIPVAYLTFPEEQHGFRKAENRERALEAELFFYGQVLGFTPAGNLRPIKIENL
ncbi:MAG: S9 family peptidase [Alphaproteobacteria bacterium]